MLSPAITTPQGENRPAASVPNFQSPYAYVIRLQRSSITDHFPSLSTQSLLPGSQKFELLRVATLARLHACAQCGTLVSAAVFTHVHQGSYFLLAVFALLSSCGAR